MTTQPHCSDCHLPLTDGVSVALERLTGPWAMDPPTLQRAIADRLPADADSPTADIHAVLDALHVWFGCRIPDLAVAVRHLARCPGACVGEHCALGHDLPVEPAAVDIFA